MFHFTHKCSPQSPFLQPLGLAQPRVGLPGLIAGCILLCKRLHYMHDSGNSQVPQKSCGNACQEQVHFTQHRAGD
jgi:hypothetical protein